MSHEAMEVYDSIRRSSGNLFAGQFPDAAINELVREGLVVLSYEGMAGFMGLPKVRVSP